MHQNHMSADLDDSEGDWLVVPLFKDEPFLTTGTWSDKYDITLSISDKREQDRRVLEQKMQQFHFERGLSDEIPSYWAFFAFDKSTPENSYPSSKFLISNSRYSTAAVS
jgi:hypothetical protein